MVLVFCFPLLRNAYSLTMERAPVAFPAAWARKATSRFAVCRGVKLKGGLGPAKLNPAPLTLTWEIVSVVLPALLTVTPRVLLLPTCTVPKFRAEALTAIWPKEGIELKNNPESRKIQIASCDRQTRILISGSLSPCESARWGVIEKPPHLRRIFASREIAIATKVLTFSFCLGFTLGSRSQKDERGTQKCMLVFFA